MATLMIPEQKLLIASDFIYDQVHAWCGPGVGKAEIHNWIQVLEGMLETTQESGWTFYAGHGGQGDQSLVNNMKNYLETFLEVTASANTKDEAINKMKQLFPGFTQDDFLLVHSVDFHVQEAD